MHKLQGRIGKVILHDVLSSYRSREKVAAVYQQSDLPTTSAWKSHHQTSAYCMHAAVVLLKHLIMESEGSDRLGWARLYFMTVAPPVTANPEHCGASGTAITEMICHRTPSPLPRVISCSFRIRSLWWSAELCMWKTNRWLHTKVMDNKYTWVEEEEEELMRTCEFDLADQVM